MTKLKKTLKKLNFKVLSKYYFFLPIKEKNLNNKYLNWINNNEISQFLTEVKNKKKIRDLYSKVNSLRTNKGEMYSIHNKKDKSHIGNLTIINPEKNKSGYYGLMIGDKTSRDIGAGGYITLMVIYIFFNHFKCRKISVACDKKNHKAINTVLKVGFKLIKNIKSVKYFELSKKKWNFIKKQFLIENLKIKIKVLHNR